MAKRKDRDDEISREVSRASHINVFLFGGYTIAFALQALWSDPATWPDGQVPGEGDAVSLTRYMGAVLHVSPPTLHSLTIDGTLTFSNDVDIELQTHRPHPAPDQRPCQRGSV